MKELTNSREEEVRMEYYYTTFNITDCNVIVDYNLSLLDMIKAGRYDEDKDKIIERFKIEGEGQKKVQLVLVYPHHNTITNGVVKGACETSEVHVGMRQLGLESAKIEHLLAFGSAYPDIQRQFPIVALNSIWTTKPSGFYGGTSNYCPILFCHEHKRCLGITPSWREGYGDYWGVSDRFLAVRK
ncbi:MAG: hypothetical protein NTX82_04950 [Candidatus Parcubacteria bacterium]|nr:hypothetical protein [Candidatus Parcubacteria bacterium]